MASKIFRATSSVSEEEMLSPKADSSALTLSIHVQTGQVFDVTIPPEASVLELKQAISEKLSSTNTDTDAFHVIHRGVVLETGTLTSHGVQHGSRIDITPRLRTGRMAPNPAEQMASIKKLLTDLAAANIPENLDQPITLSFPLGDQTVTVKIEPSGAQPDQQREGQHSGSQSPEMMMSPNTANMFASFQQLSAGGSADSEEDLPAEELERRRLVMQAAVDRARDEAAANKRRTTDNKRTSSKLEELQAKMRAKRAHRERAAHVTHTALPTGAPAPAPAPPKPAPAFAGLRRGFLSLPTPAPASPTPAPAPAPAPGSSAASSKSSFGGMKKGFLFGPSSKKQQ